MFEDSPDFDTWFSFQFEVNLDYESMVIQFLGNRRQFTCTLYRDITRIICHSKNVQVRFQHLW